MVKGRYMRGSRDRMLENFDAIGEGLIGGFAGWITGTGAAGVSEGFHEAYGMRRKFQKERKKWLRKSVIGSARSVYGSKPWNHPNPVYGSNPRPPIYGSPPDKFPPIFAKLQALGSAQIQDLQPLEGKWIG